SWGCHLRPASRQVLAEPEIRDFAHCPDFVADFAGCAAGALSAGAAVWRRLTGAPVSRQWIDFNAMSPYLPRSVVGSEDAKFCSHHGVDWEALQDVIDDAGEGEVTRGGSGITQQVAKNLFL